jgi:hypothetical protein
MGWTSITRTDVAGDLLALIDHLAGRSRNQRLTGQTIRNSDVLGWDHRRLRSGASRFDAGSDFGMLRTPSLNR